MQSRRIELRTTEAAIYLLRPGNTWYTPGIAECLASGGAYTACVRVILQQLREFNVRITLVQVVKTSGGMRWMPLFREEVRASWIARQFLRLNITGNRQFSPQSMVDKTFPSKRRARPQVEVYHVRAMLA